MALTKADLLARAARTYTEVEGVRLQSLTELERTGLEGLFAKRLQEVRESDVEVQLKAVHRNQCETLIWSIVGPDDKLMFDMGDEGVKEVGSISPDLFGKLYKAAYKHIGFGGDEDEIEGEVKKSSEAPGSN